MHAAAQAVFEQARQLHRAGSLQGAVSLYWQALALAPEHVDANHLLGLALLSLNQPQMALAQLQRAAALAPGSAAVQHNLGRAWLLMGALDPALAGFEAALRCDPAHQQAGMQRAGLLESLGRAEEAAAGFLAVATAHPQHALAHAGAARQLYRVNRVEEAVNSQARAGALDARLWADGRLGFVRAGAPTDRAARDVHSAAACVAGPGFDVMAELRRRELVVVDDFLPDPMAARSAALALPYPHSSANSSVNYPGRQTDGGHADATDLQRLANLLGRDVKWGWPGHGAYRLSPAGSLARSDIHADHDDTRAAYAGVLYLSLPEHCQGGTGFWQHRETGWARVPTVAEAAASRWGDYGRFLAAQRQAQAAAFEGLTSSRRDWDAVLHVPMRFNRLLLYRSDYFHAVMQVFGADVASSRLVQLFFFERLGERGE